MVAETMGRGSDTIPEWLSSTIALISGVVLWRLTAPTRRLASMASSGGSMWADATGRPKMAGRLLGAYAGSRALRRVLGRGHTTTAPDDTDVADAPQPAGRDNRSGPAPAEPDRPWTSPPPARRGRRRRRRRRLRRAARHRPGMDAHPAHHRRRRVVGGAPTSSAATESGAADWWTPPEPTAQPAPGPSSTTGSATPPEPDPAPAARSGWTSTPPTPGAELATLATVTAEPTTTTPSSSTAATDDEAGGTVVYTPSRGYEVRPR
ncbi:hypothetical protein HX747_31055 [Streptomyces sp. L06]|nr:hypothetical protein [Streptomyces sp. L06]